jgi:hypothetical protein
MIDNIKKTVLFLCVCVYANAQNSDAQLSPFVYIVNYIKNNDANMTNYPEFYFNEGYLNFNRNEYININKTFTPNTTEYISRNGSANITESLFETINKIPNAGQNTHIIAYSSDAPNRLLAFDTLNPNHIHINKKLYKTHGKNMQGSNGKVWFSQNGSLNLQTVGESCKANNSIVFVETKPILYKHFQGLWKSIYKDSADREFFPDGTSDSTGLHSTYPIAIGDRNVSFYGGRCNSFVGLANNATFPFNLTPPIMGEISNMSAINWFDTIIYDAGMLLMQNKSVNIDIVMFEIGKQNPFIDNLYRFVTNGFENNISISKAYKYQKLPSTYLGKLNVNLYYQFQSPSQIQTTTKQYLDKGSVKNGEYNLNATKVWQDFAYMGQQEPKTPQDMHNKFAILSYNENGHKIYHKLYITTSNLDEPCVGSGKKWQSGTIISANSHNDLLFSFYENQIQTVLLGQRQAAIYNTQNGSSYFDDGVKPNKTIIHSGIAAFVFPILLK